MTKMHVSGDGSSFSFRLVMEVGDVHDLPPRGNLRHSSPQENPREPQQCLYLRCIYMEWEKMRMVYIDTVECFGVVVFIKHPKTVYFSTLTFRICVFFQTILLAFYIRRTRKVKNNAKLRRELK